MHGYNLTHTHLLSRAPVNSPRPCPWPRALCLADLGGAAGSEQAKHVPNRPAIHGGDRECREDNTEPRSNKNTECHQGNATGHFPRKCMSLHAFKCVMAHIDSVPSIETRLDRPFPCRGSEGHITKERTWFPRHRQPQRRLEARSSLPALLCPRMRPRRPARTGARKRRRSQWGGTMGEGSLRRPTREAT